MTVLWFDSFYRLPHKTSPNSRRKPNGWFRLEIPRFQPGNIVQVKFNPDTKEVAVC
jgi:hypothetical protein